jgi:hypothetical protein
VVALVTDSADSVPNEVVKVGAVVVQGVVKLLPVIVTVSLFPAVAVVGDTETEGGAACELLAFPSRW